MKGDILLKVKAAGFHLMKVEGDFSQAPKSTVIYAWQYFITLIIITLFHFSKHLL